MDIDGQDAFNTVLDRLEDQAAQRLRFEMRAQEAEVKCRILEDQKKSVEAENVALRSEISSLRAQLPNSDAEITF
ncbi:hypothetical protein [Parvibaculum sp.]|uniref:hypothetical protein n=1 Tax=Parvibaculum sp. TaxID=2024848 RepID=UPI001D49A804|nr:hypothetical protein [Parvibaculum sp.]MBX3490860.1 hypothetical protein [Parvibaculum sp.]